MSNNDKPVVVSGVRGADKKPFTKRFQDEAAYEKWASSDAAEDYQVDSVMNESAVNMKYYNVYETVDGAKIPYAHKIYTNESDAKADGRRIMTESSYRNFAVYESEEPVEFNGKKFTSYKRFKTRELANKFLEKNEAYGVIGKKDGYVYVAKNADLGEGKYKSAAQRKAVHANKKKTNEGYKVLPAIDRERYNEIPGLEGPFRTLSGHVVYYDPKQGAYYDKDRDMYLSYDEFHAMDNDYSDMKDERDIPIREGLADFAHHADRDHEVQMARSDLYKLAEYSIKLHNMLKNVSEAEGIQGWQQAKITKAADYISSVYHRLKYEQDVEMQGMTEGKTKPGHNMRVRQRNLDKINKELKSNTNKDSEKVEESIENLSNARLKYHAVKGVPHGSYSTKEIKDEHNRRKKSEPNYHTVKPSMNETTTAGAVASVAMPMGKMQRRKKKK